MSCCGLEPAKPHLACAHHEFLVLCSIDPPAVIGGRARHEVCRRASWRHRFPIWDLRASVRRPRTGVAELATFPSVVLSMSASGAHGRQDAWSHTWTCRDGHASVPVTREVGSGGRVASLRTSPVVYAVQSPLGSAPTAFARGTQRA